MSWFLRLIWKSIFPACWHHDGFPKNLKRQPGWLQGNQCLFRIGYICKLCTWSHLRSTGIRARFCFFFFLRLYLTMSEFYWPCSPENCNSGSDGTSDWPTCHKKIPTTTTTTCFNQCWFLNCISHISAVPACNVLQVYEYMAGMKLEVEKFLKELTRERLKNQHVKWTSPLPCFVHLN